MVGRMKTHTSINVLTFSADKSEMVVFMEVIFKENKIKQKF